MLQLPQNPFYAERDPDRHYLWQRLILVDSEAFALGDWSMIEQDFDVESFEGIRCGHSSDPKDWSIAFPTLESYRDSWLAASVEFRRNEFAETTHFQALMLRTELNRIDIAGGRALCHKKFRGEVLLKNGGVLSGNRQTLYRLRKIDGTWKICGFLGQLPLELPHI